MTTHEVLIVDDEESVVPFVDERVRPDVDGCGCKGCALEYWAFRTLEREDRAMVGSVLREIQ